MHHGRARYRASNSRNPLPLGMGRIQGESIAATVRRLRLQRATGYLANTALPVAAVARKCGYLNAQSFTRAFTGVYGVSPSRYRT